MPETVLQTVGYDEPEFETVHEGVAYALRLWRDGASSLFTPGEFLAELNAMCSDLDDALRRRVVRATSAALVSYESVNPSRP